MDANRMIKALRTLTLRTWTRSLVAAALLVTAAGHAHAQRAADQRVSSQTMGWKSSISPMLKVEEAKVWRVKMQFSIVTAPEQIGTTPHGCPIYAFGAEGGVFVPVFAMGATHTTFPRSVVANFVPQRIRCSDTKVTDAGWLGEPRGMQGYYGWALSDEPGHLTIAGLATLEYELVARRVVPDVDAILAMPWWNPEDEPLDAQEALGKQVFLERGVDPETRLVRDLRGLELDQRARAYMNAARISQPRDVNPGKLVQEVAKRVLMDIKVDRDGVGWIVKQSACPLELGPPEFEEPEFKIPFILGGFDARDGLTVLREGRGSRVERAIALAAVLKQLGVPARLVVGFDVDSDDRRDAPTSPARPRKVPNLLPWVEFGLVDGENGVTHWIPIDPGRSGSAFKFGFLVDGQNRVPLTNALWHPQTEMVGNPDPCLTFDPDAGMWGFWSVGRQYRGLRQRISVAIVEPAVNEMRRGVRRPRSVAVDVDPFDAEAQAEAAARLASPAGAPGGAGTKMP